MYGKEFVVYRLNSVVLAIRFSNNNKMLHKQSRHSLAKNIFSAVVVSESQYLLLVYYRR